MKARIIIIDQRTYEIKAVAYKRPGRRMTDDQFYFTSFKLADGSAATVVAGSEIKPEEEKAVAKGADPRAMAKAEAKPGTDPAKSGGSAVAKATKPSAGEKSITKGLKGLFGVGKASDKAFPSEAPKQSMFAGLMKGLPFGGGMAGGPGPNLGAKPPGAAPPAGFAGPPPQITAPPGFSVFTNAEYGFSVLTPGEPKRLDLDVPIPQKYQKPGVPPSIMTHTFTALSNKTMYHVNVAKELQAVPAEKLEEYYKIYVAQYIDTTGGKLISQRPVRLGGLLGVEILATLKVPQTNAIIVGKSRSFLLKDVVYVVMVADPNQEVSEKQNDFFLDSFTIKGVGGPLVEGALPAAPATISAASAVPEGFKSYFSERLRMSILMPGEPKAANKDVSSPVQRVIGGSAMLKSSSVTASKSKVTYTVRSVLLPRAVPKEKVEAVLKAGERTALEGGQGKSLSEGPTKLGEVQGVDVLEEVTKQGSKEPVFVHARIYLKGERLYVVSVTAPTREAAERENAFYFESFQFKDKPDEADVVSGGGPANGARPGGMRTAAPAGGIKGMNRPGGGGGGNRPSVAPGPAGGSNSGGGTKKSDQ